jgi:hypothetical protein
MGRYRFHAPVEGYGHHGKPPQGGLIEPDIAQYDEIAADQV